MSFAGNYHKGSYIVKYLIKGVLWHHDELKCHETWSREVIAEQLRSKQQLASLMQY